MAPTRAATEPHLLHFSIDTAGTNDRALTFHAGLDDYPLHEHDATTRAQAREANRLLQLLPDAALTHYVAVDLPAHAPAMTWLTAATEVEGIPTQDFLGLALHLPRAHRRAGARRRGLSNATEDDADAKLAWLLRHYALDAGTYAAFAHLEPGVLEADQLPDLFTPWDAAAAMLYQHPGLVHLGDSGVPDVILTDCVHAALRRKPLLVATITRLSRRGGWSRRVPLRDENGELVRDDEGAPILLLDVDEDVRREMSEPMCEALRISQQLESLRDETWRVHDGATLDEDTHAPASDGPRAVVRASETRWTVQALTRMNGIRTGAVTYQPPRPGGWTLRATWSDEDDDPLTAPVVAALAAGRVLARIDAVGADAVWVGRFPAQTLRDETSAMFCAAYQSGIAGDTYATVTIALDPLRSDVEIAVDLHDDAAPHALAALRLYVVDPDGSEREIWQSSAVTPDNYGNLRIVVTNEWLRHLSCYVAFYDANEQVITPVNWISRMRYGAERHFDTHPTKKYIDLLGPIEMVFGVPLGHRSMTLDIPMPDNAASVQLYWGGMGTGRYDATACPPGIVCTAVLQLALPVIMLSLGALMNTRTIQNILQDNRVRAGLFLLGTTLSGTYIGLAQDPGRAARTVGLALGPALGKALLKKLSQYLALRGAEGAARRATPLVNLVFLAFDTAVTAFQLSLTIAAAVQSPFCYITRFTRRFDLVGRVLPDPDIRYFPPQATRMVVRVLYDAGNALPVQVHDLRSGPTRSDPLPFRFDDIAAGGQLRVFVFLYAASGWQAAVGMTPWLPARGSDETSLLGIELAVRNERVPLSLDSAYIHRQALAYENGRHVWKQRGAPQTAQNAASGLVTLTGITVAQRPAMLGYGWRGSGLNLPRNDPRTPRSNAPMYALQNIGLLEHPDVSYAIAPVGFSLHAGIAYDLGSDDDGSGANYYLDPSGGQFAPRNDRPGDPEPDCRRDASNPDCSPAGGYHLRRIALQFRQRPAFAPGSRQSWGRFPHPVDRFVVHPQGYVCGINSVNSKLYILEIQHEASTDEAAIIASLYAGEGTRIGLLLRPRGIAVALDGRLLVLDEGNRRIQSFDISGNPVPYFRPEGAAESTAVLPLRATVPATTAYLDLCVEAEGYLFVLAHSDDGTQPQHYRVDIYRPNGDFLVSTPQVAAARIAIDLARSLFTLNWETLTGPDARIEPTVSLWMPPAPEDAP